MRFKGGISGIIVILLTIWFSILSYENIQKVTSSDKECLCAYDGFGYYMYLPHLFQNGNLLMTHEWANEIQSEYCPGAPVYQLEQRNYDNPIDIYHMGLSIVFLPSYTIADIIASIGGYERNGFSTPYKYAYHLNGLLFIFLGLLYLRKLLLLFSKDQYVALALILVLLGTNATFTFSRQYDLPHLFLFSLNAIWIFHFFRFFQNDTRKNLIYAAIIFGLTTCVRPTQVILGLLPFILILRKEKNLLSTIRTLLAFPVFAFIWNIPQIIYWYTVGGSLFIPNLHTEKIVLTDPNLIDFLFSYRKGWLVYSPAFLLLIPGFFYLFIKNRTLFWGSITASFSYIYVMSSWECWWYASSFGSRVMTDIYPLLAVPLLFLIKETVKLRSKIGLALISVIVIALNLFQSHQVELGLISGDRMTKEHYWYIFGKTSISEYHTDYLLLSRADLDWPERLASTDYKEYTIIKDTILDIDISKSTIQGEYLDIYKFELYDKIQTYESQLEVILEAKTTDNTKSSFLRMEAYGKSNYMWNTFDISKDLTKNDSLELLTYRFNLDWIRHKNDGLQIYVNNPEEVEVELERMVIIARSLLRD
jgi:hypothetical protein